MFAFQSIVARRVGSAMFFIIGLGACAIDNSKFIEAKNDRDADIATCKKTYPDKHTKPVTPRVRCFNEANTRFSSRGDPNFDLMNAMAAQMLVVAERYDAGHVSDAQYDADRANVFADYRTKVLRRKTDAKIANAAQDQADAAWQATLPKTTTCTQNLDTITCR
jgi:hypothetical protein